MEEYSDLFNRSIVVNLENNQPIINARLDLNIFYGSGFMINALLFAFDFCEISGPVAILSPGYRYYIRNIPIVLIIFEKGFYRNNPV